jgi:hypothetical protein
MIGLVSESLKNLLEAEMSPATKVTLLSPVETSSHQKRVNLFLYRVVPNAHLYNRDFQPKPGVPDVLLHPPLALNLSICSRRLPSSIRRPAMRTRTR